MVGLALARSDKERPFALLLVDLRLKAPVYKCAEHSIDQTSYLKAGTANAKTNETRRHEMGKH